ncbi:MAG: hypothetical protein CR991_11730 [Proteobacteria bacterium]|nr:MAG: hypothetical protein CR991_11730 [Pseudomonadota bacterium]
MDILFSADWKPLTSSSLLTAWQAQWLQDQGSLTQKIRQVCQHDLQVKVLIHQFIAAPAFTEKELHIEAGHALLHREVLLCDGETPLVFACSLLPEVALHGSYEALRELGNRPLGHWIFSEPILQRANMHYASLPITNRLFQNLRHVMELSGSLCGRKTLFTGADKPFLVSEFFLPELQKRRP